MFLVPHSGGSEPEMLLILLCRIAVNTEQMTPITRNIPLICLGEVVWGT